MGFNQLLQHHGSATRRVSTMGASTASSPTKYAKSILLIKDYYQSIKLGAVILQGVVDPLFRG